MLDSTTGTAAEQVSTKVAIGFSYSFKVTNTKINYKRVITNCLIMMSF